MLRVAQRALNFLAVGGDGGVQSDFVRIIALALSDELDIMVSRQVNDPSSIIAMINPTRKALVPGREAERPHPQFLAWHREHCFKH